MYYVYCVSPPIRICKLQVKSCILQVKIRKLQVKTCGLQVYYAYISVCGDQEGGWVDISVPGVGVVGGRCQGPSP